MRNVLGILLVLAVLLVAAWSATSLLAPGSQPSVGNLSRHMSRLSTAISLSPANASLWQRRAKLALAVSNGLPSWQSSEEASTSLAQASYLAPSWEVPLLEMANQCASRQPSNPSNNLTACHSLYLAALLRNPTYGLTHYSYAEFLYDQAAAASPAKPQQIESTCREYVQSLHLMRRTLRNSWYRNAEARAYDRCLALVTDYSQARLLKPETDRQWLLMGLGLGKKYRDNGWAKASAPILRHLERSEINLKKYRAFSDGLAQAGQPFASYEIMRSYVSSHPSDTEGWLGLLNTMLHHRKIFSGLQVLVVIKQAQKRAQFNPDQMLILAEASRRVGKFDIAIDMLRNAIAADSGDPKKFVQLGECLLAASRPKEAIEAYQKAVKFEPDSADYRVALGLAYAKNKQYVEGVLEIQRALDLSPNNKRAKAALKKMGIY